ncbi:MAG TPA: thioesterase family protein [Polyangia bacterium]
MLTFRVMPADLDINLHMNNGRYLSIMDLGRLDFIVRTGLFNEMLRQRWMPLVGSETIRFRRSLAPLKKYELRSRLVAWDDKWFFFEQRFTARGELIAVAFVKGLLRGRQGNVAPALTLAAGGHTVASPELAPAIAAWCDADAALFETAAARQKYEE